MNRKAKLLGLLLSSAASLLSSAAIAQNGSAPKISEIIGGTYSDPSNTPFALIFSYDHVKYDPILQQNPNAPVSGYLCSGTLIEKRQILTAGHCIFNQFGYEGVVVWVGGHYYRATSIAQHPNYIEDDITSGDQNARLMNIYSDIGMITLSAPVTNVSPMPILVDDNMVVGDRLFAAGFGTNESSDTETDDHKNFRTAYLSVDALDAYAIRLSYSATNSAVCGGDSGGPVIKQVGGYRGLVAVTSQGNATMVTEEGKCVKQSDGDSTYDPRLQSQIARPFIQQFPGIVFLSSRNINFQQQFAGLKAKIAVALKARSISTLRSSAANVVRLIAKISAIADAKRYSLLVKIDKAARTAKSAKKLSDAQKALKQVGQYVNKIAAYGLN